MGVFTPEETNPFISNAKTTGLNYRNRSSSLNKSTSSPSTLSDDQIFSILNNLSTYTILYDIHHQPCLSTPSGEVFVPVAFDNEGLAAGVHGESEYTYAPPEPVAVAATRYRSGFRLTHPEDHNAHIDEIDVCYSLGLILYECTSSSIAFEGLSTQQVSQLVPMGARPEMGNLSHTGQVFTPIIESCLSCCDDVMNSNTSSEFSLHSLIDLLSAHIN